MWVLEKEEQLQWNERKSKKEMIFFLLHIFIPRVSPTVQRQEVQVSQQVPYNRKQDYKTSILQTTTPKQEPKLCHTLTQLFQLFHRLQRAPDGVNKVMIFYARLKSPQSESET